MNNCRQLPFFTTKLQIKEEVNSTNMRSYETAKTYGSYFLLSAGILHINSNLEVSYQTLYFLLNT